MADVFLKQLLCQLMRGEGGCIDALGFRVWDLGFGVSRCSSCLSW